MPPTPEHAGTLKITPSGKHFAEFSIGGGARKGTTLRTCQTKEEAEARKLEIARLVARLRETGHDAMVPNLIEDAGGFDAEGMSKLARLVERIATGKEPGLAHRQKARREGITVAELADLWTSGKLAAEYPDHVRVKKVTTRQDDARAFKWMAEVRLPDGTTFGTRPVAAVTLDDCDHVMGAVPNPKVTTSTRRAYAVTLRRLLVYAVYPLRLLPALPIPKGWLPSGQANKAKQWIYPAEDLALMQCRDVPLVRRLLYGVLVREGLRLSEALNLTWPDLDLDRGVIRLDTNKTDDPRSWALGEDVARALEAWRKLRGKKVEKIPRVFPAALVGHRTDMAHHLRAGLTLANVKRPELTIPKPGRMLLRAHDLRGTFVTLALAVGQTEAWVTDRTGHRSSQMIYLYKRASRTAAELGLGWLAPLDEAIPELAPTPDQGANGVRTRGFTGPQRNRARPQNAGRKALSRLAGTADRRFLNRGSPVRVGPRAPATSYRCTGPSSEKGESPEVTASREPRKVRNARHVLGGRRRGGRAGGNGSARIRRAGGPARRCRTARPSGAARPCRPGSRGGDLRAASRLHHVERRGLERDHRIHAVDEHRCAHRVRRVLDGRRRYRVGPRQPGGPRLRRDEQPLLCRERGRQLGAFLYTRNGAGQSISSWPVAANGALGPVTTFAGSPAASTGLVVR